MVINKRGITAPTLPWCERKKSRKLKNCIYLSKDCRCKKSGGEQALGMVQKKVVHLSSEEPLKKNSAN